MRAANRTTSHTWLRLVAIGAVLNVLAGGVTVLAAYALPPRAELTAPRLADLAGLDDAGFRRIFAGSAIKRLGRDRFVRNVLIALGNSGARSLAPAARERLGDDSPLVRAMAVWALSRLLAPAAFARLRARSLEGESDAAVRAEWRAAEPV